MQIDFHHAVTYVLARLAGFTHPEAQIVGHSAQYVDDATGQGPIYFDNRAMYSRIASAHKMMDYRNFQALANHKVWIPFHFLPSGETRGEAAGSEEDFLDRLICRPNSAAAQSMVAACIRDKHEPWSLHRLGITMHVYADTWAHQGFVGMDSVRNVVESICDFSGETDAQMSDYVKKYFKGDRWQILLSRMTSWFVEEVSPVGHGAVLSFPDRPYLKWKYRDWKNDLVVRDNPRDFLEAAQHIHAVMVRYRVGDPAAKVPPAPDKIWQTVSDMFNSITDEDGEVRHQHWLDAIAQGRFGFEPVQLEYHETGPDSWKYKALGTSEETGILGTEARWNEGFLQSDWKRFHDALQRHRQVVLCEILPNFGISAA